MVYKKTEDHSQNTLMHIGMIMMKKASSFMWVKKMRKGLRDGPEFVHLSKSERKGKTYVELQELRKKIWNERRKVE